MEKYKISVVIPVYNLEKTIIKTIDSVLKQEYTNYEIIVVDDGSTDKSYDLIDSYINKNKIKDVITLIRQKNGGPSLARNEGIKKANGEYIAFLDSDDIWMPQKLDEQVKILLQDKEIGLIGTTINNNYFKKFGYIKEISFKMMLFKNYFSTPTVLVKKSIIDELGGFDIKKSHSEDYDMWLNITNKYKSCIINKSLVICGENKPVFGHSGLSSDLKKMELGELSNYYKLFASKKINLLTYVIVSIFSYLKYLRRIAITYSMKRKHL